MTIGITKYPIVKFHLINTAAAIVWALSLGIASYQAGEILMRIAAYFSNNPFMAPVILLSILALIWFYFQKATAKKV